VLETIAVSVIPLQSLSLYGELGALAKQVDNLGFESEYN